MASETTDFARRSGRENSTPQRPAWVVPNWMRRLVLLLFGAGTAALLATGLGRNRMSMTVAIDSQQLQVRTHAATVGAVLHQVGLELHPEDRVVPSPETSLQPGQWIQVQRARPVTLTIDGAAKHLRTHATTVGELLRELGEQLGPGDEIWLDGHRAEPDSSLVSDALSARQAIPGRENYLSGVPTATRAPLVALRRAISLTVDDNRTQSSLHTTANTVGEALQAHDILLFLGDEVIPGLQDRIIPGMTVTINRSVPVTVEVEGHVIRTRTRSENIAGVLGQERIALVGKDIVEPALDAPVQPDMAIRVTRVQEAFAVAFESIPFDTVWVADPDVEIDTIKLVQEGQVGLTKHRYRVIYENGTEVNRFLEDVWAEQPPVNKTMAYGTKVVIRALDTPNGPIEYWRKMRVYTTSYTAATCGKSRSDPRYGRTRLGWVLRKGIVAVDPTVIPLKTEMYIPGYGHAIAGDTGGGVKGKFVDLGYPEDSYESWHWWTDIYLLTPVPPSSQIRWVLPDWPRYPDRARR